jgi:hypothetical protein
MKITMQEAAQKAIDVQNASNLSGIVIAFAAITDTLWDEARRQEPPKGTDFINKHPISRLFAEQIAHLTGAGSCDGNSYRDAYAECERLAAQVVS